MIAGGELARSSARRTVDAIAAHASACAWSTTDTLGAVARAIAEAVDAVDAVDGSGVAGAVAPRSHPVLPEGLVHAHAEALTPALLGAVYERLLHPTARRARGAHFTPPDVAAALVTFALDGVSFDRAGATAAPEPRLCDPACGGGVFLLAGAAWLEAHGRSRTDAARAMHGADIDPVATWVAATSLELWAPGCDAASRVRCLDALADDTWPDGSFDAVLGNPPFQNQLQTATVRSRAAHERAVARLGGTRSAYLDSAALFLARGLELVRDGGRVALVQPHATLVARDATVVRSTLTTKGRLVGLWFATEPIFAASVRVCAPVVERGSAPSPSLPPVRRAVGRSFAAAPSAPMPADTATWAPLIGDLLGVPAVRLDDRSTLGDIATATAGFRDEYYGLVGAVRDASPDEGHAPDAARLATCGLIDPLGCAWGTRPVTFAKHRYAAPIVDLDALEQRVRTWVVSQLVPKVLVATQSRIIEAFVDEHGELVPSTPLIAVHAPPDRLWHVAAALSAPCVSAHALARVAGAALSTQAIKLAARQVLALPLPVDAAAWDAGARLAEAAQRAPLDERGRLLDELGATMNTAYGCDDASVLAWWRDRRGGR